MCGPQKDFHLGIIMIRGCKLLWCQPFSAKIISMVVKIVITAHCNEEKSMLRERGGWDILERGC